MSFPPVDYSRYVWRQSKDEKGYFIREAAGGEVIEDVWNRFAHGEQNLFFGAKTSLKTPMSSLDVFLHLVRSAWVALRSSVPTVAAHTEQDSHGNSLITYRVASSQEDAVEWAKRTVRLRETSASLDDLRFELSQSPLPEANKDQTFLYVVPRSATSVDFLVYTSHVPFDGAGLKILFTKFLKALSEYISNPSLASSQTFAWGTESKDLLPVVTEILAPGEDREGPRYEKTLGGVMQDLGSAMPRQYGFKKRNIGPGPTRRASRTLSIEDSLKLRDVSRSLGLTINHLTHAAVALVCAYDNPPTSETPEDATFVFYGLVDCRSRLSAPYSSKGGYPGYCLGMSAIQIPVSVTKTEGGHKEKLLAAAEVVKKEYTKQKAYPSLLAIEPQQVDLMLAGMRSGSPPPPPWMGPWYAGDGIGETYLDPEYENIKVENFFVSLNKTDPGPFFRTFSFRNALNLSADYNVNAMPTDVVEGFMSSWETILRSILV